MLKRLRANLAQRERIDGMEMEVVLRLHSSTLHINVSSAVSICSVHVAAQYILEDSGEESEAHR